MRKIPCRFDPATGCFTLIEPKPIRIDYGDTEATIYYEGDVLPAEPTGESIAEVSLSDLERDVQLLKAALGNKLEQEEGGNWLHKTLKYVGLK